MAQRSARSSFAEGIRDISPILIGVAPFGIIAGVAAVEAGLATIQAIAMSPLIFAGASQLATSDLIARDAAPAVIVLTALVINSRFSMYSASLAPHFRGLGPGRTLLSAYVLTDQAFAVSTIRFTKTETTLQERFWYYLGASLSLWVTWQVSSIVGVVVGGGVPPEWSLDFAIPLVFLALVFPAVTDRATRVAAIVGAIGAAVFATLPLNLGLLAAAACGIAAGLLVDRRRP